MVFTSWRYWDEFNSPVCKPQNYLLPWFLCLKTLPLSIILSCKVCFCFHSIATTELGNCNTGCFVHTLHACSFMPQAGYVQFFLILVSLTIFHSQHLGCREMVVSSTTLLHGTKYTSTLYQYTHIAIYQQTRSRNVQTD